MQAILLPQLHECGNYRHAPLDPEDGEQLELQKVDLWVAQDYRDLRTLGRGQILRGHSRKLTSGHIPHEAERGT